MTKFSEDRVLRRMWEFTCPHCLYDVVVCVKIPEAKLVDRDSDFNHCYGLAGYLNAFIHCPACDTLLDEAIEMDDAEVTDRKLTF